MKKLCRIVSGALAALFAAVLLAGCSDGENSGTFDMPTAAPTGGYVEEDVSPTTTITWAFSWWTAF